MVPVFREACSRVLNIPIDDRIWEKLTLPLQGGGLGIRSPADLAVPCYVSSLHSVAHLVKELLPEEYHTFFDDKAEACRSQDQGMIVHDESDWCSQSALDTLRWERKFESMSTADDELEKARLLASRHRFSYLWLEAVPSSNVGTLLLPLQFQLSAGLRLGARFAQPHPCAQCGQQVQSDGVHGLSCRFSQGRHSRHSELNQIISSGLRAAAVPNLREPTHLTLENGKRPDGVTLVPYSRGRHIIWDATVVDTLAPSYISATSLQAGAASTLAEQKKRAVYATFARDYDVVPIAFETLGSTCSQTEEFLGTLAKRICRAQNDQRSGQYFLQRLSLAIQRGNAVSIYATMGEEVNENFVM